VKPSDLFPRATSGYYAVAGCAAGSAGSARPFGTHLGAGFFASTLRPWNKEAYAEARLPRNAVAWLKAISDTKIGRLDEARSTRSFHFLPLFTRVRGIGILGCPEVRRLVLRRRSRLGTLFEGAVHLLKPLLRVGLKAPGEQGN
jgi:hypothetical protein